MLILCPLSWYLLFYCITMQLRALRQAATPLYQMVRGVNYLSLPPPPPMKLSYLQNSRTHSGAAHNLRTCAFQHIPSPFCVQRCVHTHVSRKYICNQTCKKDDISNLAKYTNSVIILHDVATRNNRSTTCSEISLIRHLASLMRRRHYNIKIC